MYYPSKNSEDEREDEILRGYVLLVRQMLINVFDKIRIKKIWHTKPLSEKMINKKIRDLNYYGDWLHTDDATTWFDFLGYCMDTSGHKMYRTFIETHKQSVAFMKKKIKESSVDKSRIDAKLKF